MFPGLDLHTRSRAALCTRWKRGDRDVLDAGSGNGYFSWLAYQSGARVIAMNMNPGQVDRSKLLLVNYRGGDPARLQFEVRNLYDLGDETRRFDEIICYETLEHVRRDAEVCRHFYRLLKPAGVLHLCCPYRLHPRHQREVLDENEEGGHVRAGYTQDDYRALLEPIGFQIDEFIGLGGPALFHADRLLRAVCGRLGHIVAMPLFPLLLPFALWPQLNPSVPFSLYCRATTGLSPQAAPAADR